MASLMTRQATLIDTCGLVYVSGMWMLPITICTSIVTQVFPMGVSGMWMLPIRMCTSIVDSNGFPDDEATLIDVWKTSKDRMMVNSKLLIKKIKKIFFNYYVIKGIKHIKIN